MPKAREPRFSIEQISAEIERVRIRLGVSVTDAAKAVPCLRTTWYKKVKVTESRFHLEEMERLAYAWKAPRGWPFLPWELAEAFEAWLASRHRLE